MKGLLKKALAKLSWKTKTLHQKEAVRHVAQNYYKDIDYLVEHIDHLTVNQGKRFKRAVRWAAKNQGKPTRAGNQKKPPRWIAMELSRFGMLRKEFIQDQGVVHAG